MSRIRWSFRELQRASEREMTGSAVKWREAHWVLRGPSLLYKLKPPPIFSCLMICELSCAASATALALFARILEIRVLKFFSVLRIKVDDSERQKASGHRQCACNCRRWIVENMQFLEKAFLRLPFVCGGLGQLVPSSYLSLKSGVLLFPTSFLHSVSLSCFFLNFVAFGASPDSVCSRAVSLLDLFWLYA